MERVDDLQRDNLVIIQDTDRFCFGIDAVILSSFAKAKPSDCVLDMGTGTGVIPILMSSKTKAHHLTGLEIQLESAKMASRSVQMNHLDDRINIVEGDIKEASSIFGEASFNIVTCNPPYMVDNHGLQNPEEAKAIARHEILCTLEDVIREGSKVLKPSGKFYMVHRPFRVADIICLMRQYNVEVKRMKMVQPFEGKEPNMVLIEGQKNSKPRMIVEEPLIIYEKQGVFSKQYLEFIDCLS